MRNLVWCKQDPRRYQYYLQQKYH